MWQKCFQAQGLHVLSTPFGEAPERIEIEAGPRHSELLIKNSGLQTNSK